jgi:hypothetical protein
VATSSRTSFPGLDQSRTSSAEPVFFEARSEWPDEGTSEEFLSTLSQPDAPAPPLPPRRRKLPFRPVDLAVAGKLLRRTPVLRRVTPAALEEARRFLQSPSGRPPDRVHARLQRPMRTPRPKPVGPRGRQARADMEETSRLVARCLRARPGRATAEAEDALDIQRDPTRRLKRSTSSHELQPISLGPAGRRNPDSALVFAMPVLDPHGPTRWLRVKHGTWYPRKEAERIAATGALVPMLQETYENTVQSYVTPGQAVDLALSFGSHLSRTHRERAKLPKRPALPPPVPGVAGRSVSPHVNDKFLAERAKLPERRRVLPELPVDILVEDSLVAGPIDFSAHSLRASGVAVESKFVKKAVTLLPNGGRTPAVHGGFHPMEFLRDNLLYATTSASKSLRYAQSDYELTWHLVDQAAFQLRTPALASHLMHKAETFLKSHATTHLDQRDRYLLKVAAVTSAFSISQQEEVFRAAQADPQETRLRAKHTAMVRDGILGHSSWLGGPSRLADTKTTDL